VQEKDVLWFAGDVSGLAYLMKLPGLLHPEKEQIRKAGLDLLERRLVQVSCVDDLKLMR
jgi:hypothetical protein